MINFSSIEQLICLVRCLVDKILFWLDNPYLRQKKLLSFSGRQKFQFFPNLAPQFDKFRNNFMIKQNITEIVMFNLLNF